MEFVHAVIALDRYFRSYNTNRPHQGLCYLTPADVYFAATRK